MWDAGNFNMDDAVYRAAHAIAKDGDLPLRWEGSYHIWAPEQIDTAAHSLLRLREEYGHGKLRFNTVKIHYDGMQDILTAAMLEPYLLVWKRVWNCAQRPVLEHLSAHGIPHAPSPPAPRDGHADAIPRQHRDPAR